MAEPSCATCKLRASYDKNPKSFLGRFWRWHIKWCPGWKGYMKSITKEKKSELAEKYNLPLK